MAEIHIERKTRKKPVWPWVLLLLVVLGIVAWLMLADESTDLSGPTDEVRINYHQNTHDAYTVVGIQIA